MSEAPAPPPRSLACAASLAFLAGAFFEAACVMWTHSSERGLPVQTALWSMVVAFCQVVGIVESVRDRRAAPFLVLGYGVGSYAVVAARAWMTGQ